MPDFGISVALLTPFDDGGRIDPDRLAIHAADVMGRGASSVTLFGTTGEGASISQQERETGLRALRDGGLTGERIVLGLSGCAVDDVEAQVAQGLDHGVRLFLLPPPFYFSTVTEDGLFAWHAALFRSLAEDARFLLYNIPQVTGVAVSPRLTARLMEAYPERLAGIKDSSGDWSSARAFLQLASLSVLIGDERLLHRAVPLGCAGSITGMANLFPERLARILETGREDPDLSDMVDRVVAGPVNPSLKVLLAAAKQDPGWERVRPPLAPPDETVRADMLSLMGSRHG